MGSRWRPGPSWYPREWGRTWGEHIIFAIKFSLSIKDIMRTGIVRPPSRAPNARLGSSFPWPHWWRALWRFKKAVTLSFIKAGLSFSGWRKMLKLSNLMDLQHDAWSASGKWTGTHLPWHDDGFAGVGDVAVFASRRGDTCELRNLHDTCPRQFT